MSSDTSCDEDSLNLLEKEAEDVVQNYYGSVFFNGTEPFVCESNSHLAGFLLFLRSLIIITDKSLDIVFQSVKMGSLRYNSKVNMGNEMNETKIRTVSEQIERVDDCNNKHSVDLDEALALAGFGCYNIRYCLVLALFLMAVIVEPTGLSYVLPAAKCDLDMSDAVRGFLASVPFIGLILTSFVWGYLVDTKGRKRMVIISSYGSGFFGMLAAFMPEQISFIVCKFITSLCLTGPAMIPYTYISEIVPQRHKDVTLSVVNALQITGSALVPLLAWAVLPFDFRADFGLYEFRPWRLLVILNALLLVIGATLMCFGPESPKFLVATGKHDDAMVVLKKIYAGNNRNKLPDSYVVKSIKMSEKQAESLTFFESVKRQSVPLLRPPLLKWLLLIGFLLFGVFSMLTGLYIWVPDILNRVINGDQIDQTTCQIIAQRFNQTTTDSSICIDTIQTQTFIINFVANMCCAVIAVGGSSSVKIIGKKCLLLIVFFTIGTFTILINFISDSTAYATLLSSFPVMGMTIGPISAFAVDKFPTHLRGMAISLTMMIGRCGSVMGTNVSGALLNYNCEATFYFFGGLLILCGLMVFLLPGPSHKTSTTER